MLSHLFFAELLRQLRLQMRGRVTVTESVTLPIEHGSRAWTFGLRFFNRYFVHNIHHGTRSRRMDSAAHPVQATFRGRRKKTVRQGAQVVSVLSITARPLYFRIFSSRRLGPSFICRQERY